MIDLTIKTLDSQNHKFKVPDTFNILQLKEHIAEQVNVAVVQQRLIFCGRVLSNETKLSDIGIDGKVMHLVQKVPRLSTTTSGPSSSTTTNTNSRSGQNGGPGFRGWHAHDPTVLFGAIGIPSELISGGEIPRLINARNQGTSNRLSLALDMIRRSNEILSRIENPRATGRTSATDVIDVEQFPEESQQAESTSENVSLESPAPESSMPASSTPESSLPASSAPESSSIPTQLSSDPDSVNVSYEVDETFPNTVVVTIDATHHMRMPPGLLRHMHNHLQQAHHLPFQNPTEQTVDSDSTTQPETTLVESTNQASEEQATRPSPPPTTSDQNLRNERLTPPERALAAMNDRRRLKELIDQLNKLNVRLQPFFVQYCQYINEDPQFESTEGENGSHRAQSVFNGVSEVMHYISHVYHAISDLRVAFNRQPPRTLQTRPCLLQGTIVHSAHSVTTSAAAPPPPPPTQQPTSTQTTNTSQSIPSVRAFRLDFMSPEIVASETPNVSTQPTSAETNTSMNVDPNTESNNTSTEFPSEAPHGVELMFDLGPGTIQINSVEASLVAPNASGSSQPTAVSQPSSGSETSNNMSMPGSMPVDWMDQVIDVISSGVRRPLMAEQTLDWSSIPTTSTRTPRVTPRTTDSSGPVPQGLNRSRWDNSPRIDPFLPCSSHHFESNLRPMVLARRSTQGADRSTSSNSSGNSTTDTATPTSPNEIRPFSVRRTGRPRTRYVQDSEGYLSGIHPILTWGRTHRTNAATTAASNNTNGDGLTGGISDALAGQIRVGMESVFDSLEREVDLDRARHSNSSSGSSNVLPVLESLIGSIPRPTSSPRHELLLSSIGDLSYFRDIEGRFILVDLFLLIARNWNLYDILNLNITELESTIVQHPVSRNSEAIVWFILNRIMRNQTSNNQNIEEAANRIYVEMAAYINIFQLSVPTRTNIDVFASFRRCIVQNLQRLVNFCERHRYSNATDGDIVSALTVFAEGLLSLVVYCCGTRAVFRLCVGALVQFLPLPSNLHRLVIDTVLHNIDHYWDNLAYIQVMSLSVVEHIVPFGSSEFEGGQTSRVGNEEQSSNSTPGIDNVPDTMPIPEVVIGSQEWHHSVPSDWVPVIARDSQRQRRQGTQPPYSDAYLSGMPNKRRKIVANSKPQGSLSQIISQNLEVAMGAAGVSINKELTANVGADAAVQNAYTERIKMLGRSGLDTNPDFCPDRYPNASKFFYDHNRPN